jgi:putative flippase GtrA
MRRLLAHRRQFVVFVAGGVLCALLDIGIMQLLFFQGLHVAAATSAGFAAGLLLNYAFHAHLTFAAAATGPNFTRYLCVVGINYLITLACVSTGAALAGSALAGKLVALPVSAVNGFLLSKFWVYK